MARPEAIIVQKLLSRAATTQFAAAVYGHKRLVGSVSLMAHADVVADVAEALYRHWAEEHQPWSVVMNRLGQDAVWHAALLHEAIDCGATYEDIVWLTQPDVGEYVAAMSLDRRLPLSRRLSERNHAIGSGSLPVQIIGAADLLLEAAIRAQHFWQCPGDSRTELSMRVMRMNELYAMLKPLFRTCAALEYVGRAVCAVLRWLREAEESVSRWSKAPTTIAGTLVDTGPALQAVVPPPTVCVATIVQGKM